MARRPDSDPLPRDARYRFLARFGSVILSGGIAAVPRALYYYQAELGLLPQEVWFVGYILAHRWTAELPYPSLRKMAHRTGVTYQMLHRYKNSLIAKHYLQVIPRSRQNGGRTTNSYDFSGLFQALERLLLRDRGLMEESIDDPDPDLGDADDPSQPELIAPRHSESIALGKARLSGGGQRQRPTSIDPPGIKGSRCSKEVLTTTTKGPVAREHAPFSDLLTLYAEANGQPATPLQARSLRELAAEIDRVRGSGQGVRWLRQAIEEAAEAGSGYLAPRRLRRICERWLREGLPANSGAQSDSVSRTATRASVMDWQPLAPGLWATARDQLAGTLSVANFRAFIAESRPIGRNGNRFCLAVPDALTAQRLTGPLRSAVEAALAAALDGPVRLECQVVRRPGSQMVTGEMSAGEISEDEGSDA